MLSTTPLLLATALSLCTSISYADETRGILGQLKDTNGKPVNNATITIGNKSDFTDVEGQYRIKGLPAGNYKVQAKKGTNQTEETVEIKEGIIKKDLLLQ